MRPNPSLAYVTAVRILRYGTGLLLLALAAAAVHHFFTVILTA